MKTNKKLFSLLMALLLLLCACSNSSNYLKENSTDKIGNVIDVTTEDITTEDETTNASVQPEKQFNYNFSIYSDGRSFSKNDITTQSEFEDFIKEIFVERMSDNTINLHFSIENPSNYGIEDFPATWGEFSIEELENSASELSGLLDTLTTFNYTALTYEQQLIYDILKEYLENQIELSPYYLLESVFAPMSGMQSEIPIVFSEYAFNSKDDVDDYITLLTQSKDYISKLCNFENYRAEKGYVLSDNAIKDVIDQCNEFIEADPICLITIFNERIGSVTGLTSDEIDEYKDANKVAVNDYLVPAYELIIETLTKLKGSDNPNTGLINYENGTKYYELLVKHETGSSKTVDELIEMTQADIEDAQTEVYKLYIKDSDLFDQLENYKNPITDPDKMLQSLSNLLKEDFPAAVNDSYTLNYVHKSLENMMNPAFYLIPPIDNPKRNIIYINNAPQYKEMDLFSTIAHEGFPGHMYQCNYFSSLNPHYFRSLLSFNGYSEGWAEYIETCYSYKYAGMDDDLANMFELNQRLSFGFYCMVDMGINYKGWSYDDTADYLSTYAGINDKESIDSVYNTMVNEPAVYLRYYIGYKEILNLKEIAEEALGSGFEIKEFHRFLLEIGPSQFSIIEDRMNDWIERVKNSN